MSAVKYMRIGPESGSAAVTISSSPQQSVFEFKAEPCYLAKSYLEFNVKVPASSNADYYNYLYSHLLPYFTRVKVSSNAGGPIVDIDNLHHANALMLRPSMSFTEMKSDCTGAPATTAALAKPVSGLVKVGEFALARADINTNPKRDPLKWYKTAYTATFTSAVVAAVGVAPVGTVAVSETNVTGDMSAQAIPYSPLRPSSGAVTDIALTDDSSGLLYGICSGANADGYVKYQIPLARFVNTLLANNDCFYLPSIIRIEFTWNVLNGCGFELKAGTSLYPAASSATAVLENDIVVSNLGLQLAMERNQSVIDEVKAVPSRTIYFSNPQRLLNQTMSTAGAQNLHFNVSKSHGLALKSLWTGVFDTASSLHLQYLHNNLTVSTGALGARVTNYQHMIDGTYIEPKSIDCTVGEDLGVMQVKLEGSALSSGEQYAYNWFAYHDFSLKNRPIWMDSRDNSDQSGRPLDESHTIDINLTTVGTANQAIVFGVFARALTVNLDGSIIVA